MTHNVMCAVKDTPPGPCDCGHGPAVDARVSELRPSDPGYPDMDALRLALDRYDNGRVYTDTQSTNLANAARAVLATFDRQMAQMAAMRAQHVDAELLRRALDLR